MMVSSKRKAAVEERPSKKLKSRDENGVQQESVHESSRTTATLKQRLPAEKTILGNFLKDEERAFPRGGANILTPIEQKQIKAQAEHDALFEQDAGIDGGELFDTYKTQHLTDKTKKRNKKGSDGIPKINSSSFKAQSLGYKTLVPGSVILGRITSITTKDVALALPNNLTGFVSITAISSILNRRIDKILSATTSVESDDDDDETDVRLSKLFYVGQWLRAVVTPLSVEAQSLGRKSKRRIELSIDPQMVNPNLMAEDIVPHCVIQAAIRSVEDHGIVMDLGLPDINIRGFVSKKDLGSTWAITDLEEGQVMMCLVTGKGTNGKVLKLSPDASRFSVLGKTPEVSVLEDFRSIAALVPGTAVTVLVTESTASGVKGTITGLLDVSADLLHSTFALQNADQKLKIKIGDKIKARIIFTVPTDDGNRSVGISVLESLLSLPPPATRLATNASAKQRIESTGLESKFPDSTIIDGAIVTQVEPQRGLFLDLTAGTEQSTFAFAHISQISDNRVDSLSQTTGPYKIGTTHKIRIMSYNPVDNTVYVSLKPSVLEQPYFRLEDIHVGEKVQGIVERLMLGGKTGIIGVLVRLSDNITGLVPEVHLSDTSLQNPERKFREATSISARVLSIDSEKRQIRLTLKKSLMESDESGHVWSDYRRLEVGMSSKGTVINLLSAGAVIQFYGNVRAWLPVSEMSESFVESPSSHLRLGQTVDTHIISINADTEEMKVSCKSIKTLDDDQSREWDSISGGMLVSGTVTMKAQDRITLELEIGLSGLLKFGHLTDGGAEKAEKAASKIRVGQRLQNMVVLNKNIRGRHLLLSQKKSLVQSVQDDSLLQSFDDVVQGAKVHGFVRNITPEGIYTEFANSLVGLVPKSQITPEMATKTSFGLIKDQTIHAWILNVDALRQRFTLSMRPESAVEHNTQPQLHFTQLVHPIDPSLTSTLDLSVGRVTRARITSIKGTQLNVQLADNIHGRIDVSEAFDSWTEIINKMAPLEQYSSGDITPVKLLGLHDARNHRFLPLSHRQSSNRVFELSAKKQRIHESDDSLLSLNSVETSKKYTGFVNNHGPDCVWVNLSPNVRGRVAFMDLTNDVKAFQNLPKFYPIGSAIQVTVKKVDTNLERLDLTAQSATQSTDLKFENISLGSVLPARITKIAERSIHVQLNDDLAAPVPFVELGDDYDLIDLQQFHKNDVVRACVTDLDDTNQRLFLSLRPSKTLSSSLPITDPHISRSHQLKIGDVIRGFVKHISDKGVFVSLGNCVDAFVRVRDLTDSYVKDWKSIVNPDQLVKGRVLQVDETTKHITLSLRASHVDEDYKPPLTLDDLNKDMIVTGKVRKVEDFGAFIDLDNTQPRLSGLCHRSEVAEKRIEDVRNLYQEGDRVKAIILKIDRDGRKISLGLKASYFMGDEEDVGDVDMVDGVTQERRHEEDLSKLMSDKDELSDVDDSGASEDDGENGSGVSLVGKNIDVVGLQTGGFDWTGAGDMVADDLDYSEAENDVTKRPAKRKSPKSKIQVDHTGDLDKFGPTSVSDFERQLLGRPNSSELWIQYMAFQLKLGETQKARDIAARALKTIHIRETEEKADIWIACLNLEAEYGGEEQVSTVFQEACKVQDSLQMHEKLVSIYINAKKYTEASNLLDTMVHNKVFRASPDVWTNYASFLMSSMANAQDARGLLARALQSVPSSEHRALSARFAALEFRSENGNAERGRTIFESLLSEWPKWTSGWDMWVDLERSRVPHLDSDDRKQEAIEKTRELYQRIAVLPMKRRRAKFFFKKWLEFEEQEGANKDVERVKVVATEFASKSMST